MSSERRRHVPASRNWLRMTCAARARGYATAGGADPAGKHSAFVITIVTPGICNDVRVEHLMLAAWSAAV
jgi:hypothetical protein